MVTLTNFHKLELPTHTGIEQLFIVIALIALVNSLSSPPSTLISELYFILADDALKSNDIKWVIFIFSLYTYCCGLFQ